MIQVIRLEVGNTVKLRSGQICVITEIEYIRELRNHGPYKVKFDNWDYYSYYDSDGTVRHGPEANDIVQMDVSPVPEVAGLRDQFAMSAMSGLVGKAYLCYEDLAADAYDIADEMMKARKNN